MVEYGFYLGPKHAVKGMALNLHEQMPLYKQKLKLVQSLDSSINSLDDHSIERCMPKNFDDKTTTEFLSFCRLIVFDGDIKSL